MSTPEPTIIDRNVGPTDIIPSVSIDNMIRMRAAVIDRIDQAIAHIREATEIANAAHLGGLDAKFDLIQGSRVDFLDADAAEEVRRQIDAGAWQYLLHESGLRTFMDARARQEWDEQIAKGTIPPLTRENVTATFEVMHAARGDMLDRGVIECFRNLSWNYKTNQPFKFGKRIILGYLFSTYGSGKQRWLSLNHGQANRLDDLMRVMSVLDGKIEPDHRHGVSSAIGAAHRAGLWQWSGPYFAIRWFRKGSGHVTFTRPDLVDQLNQILAKHFPRALDAPHD